MAKIKDELTDEQIYDFFHYVKTGESPEKRRLREYHESDEYKNFCEYLTREIRQDVFRVIWKK